MDTPHIALPFRLNAAGTSLVKTEQDSLAEISDCVEAIIRCPNGHRIDLPEFGLPDQAFNEGGADVNEIRETLELWEPRADTLIEEEPEEFDALISRVRIEIEEQRRE